MEFHNLISQSPLDRPLTIAIAGAGGRGSQYARMNALLENPARIVAVADPAQGRLDYVRDEHGVPEDGLFHSWRELAGRPRLADAILICTQDNDHLEPTLAFARLGYDILLEKPMAITEAECEAIEAASREYGVSISVCHVLRYTPYTVRLMELLGDGAIGDIVSVEHLEPIGFDHFAHSYVRGSWRTTKEAAPMLMAKSCHDIDWLSYVIGRPVERVQSFGSLRHFTAANKPAGAADRCVGCAVAADCPYDATRIYEIGNLPFALSAMLGGRQPTPELVSEALLTSQYGRCVYECDNDVADHQVVNLEYEGGVTASFTVTAFTLIAGRKTSIFGTHGMIVGDSDTISVTDFGTKETVVHPTAPVDHTASGGHGGGDYGLMKSFVEALSTGKRELILTDVAESLATHKVVFAAERSRETGTVVTV
ncbi:oxidoreductase [Actinorhabdospora filicis]|uniref:Oxidoreductase n=1 Tax=Actinorhabdospora filicis TaxID=1785913 RepID=A0A9W6SPK4_9ACTN|nr:Gfo/Idh/MocA family oxidoreductase [Actinorhabdospora filicis]GLZ79783.1 oxidoreductase [Actinorhabdospora filicis]